MKAKTFVAVTIFALGLSIMLWLRWGEHSEYDDQSFIDSAVDYYVNIYQKGKTSFTNFDGTRGVTYRPYSPVREFQQDNPAYATIMEFVRDNPNCCRYSYRGSDGALPGWYARWSNDYEGVVTLTDKRQRLVGDVLTEYTFQFEIQMNSDTVPILPIISLYVEGN